MNLQSDGTRARTRSSTYHQQENKLFNKMTIEREEIKEKITI